jgi:AMP-binding enzyme C-terminal domain
MRGEYFRRSRSRGPCRQSGRDLPDDKWGEAVTAVIVPKPGASPSERELIELVKPREGATHAPKQVKFVSELPITGVGKVHKKVLRARILGRARPDGGLGRRSRRRKQRARSKTLQEFRCFLTLSLQQSRLPSAPPRGGSVVSLQDPEQ